MTHKRLLGAAVIAAVVVVLAVVAVITVIVEDFIDPPDARSRMRSRCGSRYTLAS
ncbi:hypothetical protein [Glycomyces terrestris]|uniref:hypothetical protein n=1 Tax=Glycomyces terrestris TaxID=2493553 RepID=UPI0013154542|nr:hypothetical protein [Glycomyces terrestris]